MKHKVGEVLASIAIVAVLGITTILIFHFAPWKNNTGKRVIFLTAVARNGVWTEEKVNGTNYWLKDFKQAVIVLNKGEEVILRFTSMDVSHSFYAPELNIGPVVVLPGKVYDVPFKASKTGSFKYYCTQVCGTHHFYMQGKIIILEANKQLSPTQIVKMQIDSIIKGKDIAEDSMKLPKNFVERGKYLFANKNCISCHGKDGVGGINNTNYQLKTVPALNTLGTKLKIPDKETADGLIKLMEKNIDLNTLDEEQQFSTFNRFLAQYNTVTKKILEGASVVQKENKAGPYPPLTMPAWENYLTNEEINAIIAYLITQNKWEEEE